MTSCGPSIKSIQSTCSHASRCNHRHHCNVDFVLFHNATHCTNSLLSCIHVFSLISRVLWSPRVWYWRGWSVVWYDDKLAWENMIAHTNIHIVNQTQVKFLSLHPSLVIPFSPLSPSFFPWDIPLTSHVQVSSEKTSCKSYATTTLNTGHRVICIAHHQPTIHMDLMIHKTPWRPL